MELYKIFSELKLIVNYYFGEVSVSDLKIRMQAISLDSAFSEEYDIVNDFRDCNLNVHVNDLISYIDYLQNEIRVITKRKSVLLTNKPNQVVLTTIFSNKLLNTQLTPLVCSTIDAAIPFLNKKGLDKKTLERMILELKENSKKS